MFRLLSVSPVFFCPHKQNFFFSFFVGVCVAVADLWEFHSHFVSTYCSISSGCNDCGWVGKALASCVREIERKYIKKKVFDIIWKLKYQFYECGSSSLEFLRLF